MDYFEATNPLTFFNKFSYSLPKFFVIVNYADYEFCLPVRQYLRSFFHTSALCFTIKLYVEVTKLIELTTLEKKDQRFSRPWPECH